jgi:hypothetical protein
MLRRTESPTRTRWGKIQLKFVGVGVRARIEDVVGG